MAAGTGATVAAMAASTGAAVAARQLVLVLQVLLLLVIPSLFVVMLTWLLLVLLVMLRQLDVEALRVRVPFTLHVGSAGRAGSWHGLLSVQYSSRAAPLLKFEYAIRFQIKRH